MRGVTFADTVTLLLVELAKKKTLKGNRTSTLVRYLLFVRSFVLRSINGGCNLVNNVITNGTLTEWHRRTGV